MQDKLIDHEQYIDQHGGLRRSQLEMGASKDAPRRVQPRRRTTQHDSEQYKRRQQRRGGARTTPRTSVPDAAADPLLAARIEELRWGR